MLWRVFPQIMPFILVTLKMTVYMRGVGWHIFFQYLPPPTVTPPPSNDFCCGVGRGGLIFFCSISQKIQNCRHGTGVQSGAPGFLLDNAFWCKLRTTVHYMNFCGKEYNHFNYRCGSGSGRIGQNLADPDPDPFDQMKRNIHVLSKNIENYDTYDAGDND